MRLSLVKVLAVLCLFYISIAANAAPGKLFNVNAAGSSANVQIQLCLNARGPLSCQNFTVSGLTLSILTTISNRQYPSAGIKVLTPGYTLQTGCTPLANNYCAFSANDQTPTVVVISSSQVTRFAYVGSDSINDLIFCTVDASSGALSGCMPTGSGFTTPSDVAINAAGTRAYVSTEASGVGIFLCDVNSTTGELSNCVITGASMLDVAAIALNPAGNYLYLADYSGGNAVFKCSVNASTGTISACVTVGAISFQNPATIAFNTAGTLAYVGSRSNDISLCTVDISTGAFTVCGPTAVGVSDSPMGIALNRAGTLAYITDASADFVYVCMVNQSTGELSSCINTGSGFLMPNSIAINAAGTIAYVANESNSTVSQCNINQSNGLLSGCVLTGSGFAMPTNIALS